LLLERSDLSVEAGQPRGILRGIRATGQFEDPALCISNLGTNQRRFGVQPLFLRPPQAECTAGDQVGQRSRTRALERLECIREPAMVEQLSNRRVVEIDPVGGKRSTTGLVT
jgi:hypothetical protein